MSIKLQQERSVLAELGEVLWLSLPIIITMTSHSLMQFVDALMLGRYGKHELAAVVPAGMTYFILASFLLGVSSCNNTFVSQSLGRGQRAECGRYTVHAIYLAILAQPFMVPLAVWADDLFRLMGHEESVRELEATYFRVRAFQMAATGSVVAIATFFQGTSRPVVPMLTGLAANALNIVGDWVLIFGQMGFPRLGILGAATATTAASYFELGLLLSVFLLRSNRREYGTARWWPIEIRRIARLVRVGVGAGTTFMLDTASWTLFAAWLIGRLGTAYLAGNAAATQVMALSFMPTMGLNIGLTALVGRRIGEGNIAGAKRCAYVAMALASTYMTLMGLTAVLLRRQVLALFSPLVLTTTMGLWRMPDDSVIRAGGIILMYAALFQFSDAIGILSFGALKGAGDTAVPALMQMALAFAFFLPLAWFIGAPERWGVHGCWIAATVYIWAIDGALFWRFVSEGWRKIDIFR